MLRIRLHGRGGQGIKTASQILGSAAFLAGWQAQDFPLYGAERRGAPITAYARMDREAVRERGNIVRPDVLLIGDETLLTDSLAAPMSGVAPDAAVFINSPHTASQLQKHYALPALPQAADLTELCLRHLRKGTALSAALAAAGARIAGFIGADILCQAIAMELAQQGMDSKTVQDNQELARVVYALASSVTFQPRQDPLPAPTRVIDIPLQPARDAAPVILETGNMRLRQTGNWRLYRPEIVMKDCVNCWICFARCPDGAIGIDAKGWPFIDYEHCKGCMICAEECPPHAITSSREAASWT